MEMTNNIRYFLQSKELGKVQIEEIKDFDEFGGDSYELQKDGYFTVEKSVSVTLYEKGYIYLLGLMLPPYGPTTQVRLIKEVKDDLSMNENWKEVSNTSVNMYTLEFKEENDNPSVNVELIAGANLKIVEEVFSDEFDIQGPNVDPLSFVNLRLDPRAILKRSKFVSGNGVVDAKDDKGATARALPLQAEYSSQSSFVGTVSNNLASSVNDTYATLRFGNNCFISNAPQDFIYTINGKVSIEVTNRASTGYLHLDLVRYNNGQEQNFDEIILRLDSGNPGVQGEILEFQFNDYQLEVKAGDSIGIMTLSNTDNGGVSGLDLKYKVTEDTELFIETPTPAPLSYTKAVKPFDMFQHLIRLATNDNDIRFISSVFGEGQRHEDKLLVHGTWLRNMPTIINEGEDDERRIQANLSLENLFDAYRILEPLRWDVLQHKGKPTFTVGAMKDIQQNFTGIRIGETTDKFKLFEVSDKSRDVLGDNYFRKIKIGSKSSGSNYGQVNNLYSTSGYGEWSTVNSSSESDYEVTTDFRTGAEDIELQRQFQFSDSPDQDGEYDNDWFLVDAKMVNGEYVVKKWADYYEEAPRNIFSVDTNYNWPFLPTELLKGHGYYINAGLQEKPNESLTKPTGNCNLSVITKKAGEVPITGNQPFPHSLLDKPRIRPMMVNFEVPINQEIIDQLRGSTNGVDNKFGLVEVLYKGEILKGRLIEAVTDDVAKFSITQIPIAT